MTKTSISILVLLSLVFLIGNPSSAADLDEIRSRGVLRHIGLPYANFNTGTGAGFEVELTRMFAKSLGVRYEFVESDWGRLVEDLTGRKVTVHGGKAELGAVTEVRGDLIANGFTILPWRQQVVNFSTQTFPNQIWLVARADSPIRPIKPTGNINKDIEATKSLMKGKSLITVSKTCLDPSLYALKDTSADIIDFKGKLNEVAPALLNNDAELAILDVPDALVALDKWNGKIKILGPISDKQQMAAGFDKGSPRLLDAYNSFIKRAQSNGTYLKLVNKYYPSVKTYFPEFFKGMR